MSHLDISTPGQQTAYRPGDWLEAKAVWQLDQDVEWLEVRLIWFTQGKGDSDVSVEDKLRIDKPPRQDSRAFRFPLPAAPYSFSGKLISLIWAVEIVAEGTKDAARLEFTLAPEGREVELGTVPPTGAELMAQRKAQSLLNLAQKRRAPPDLIDHARSKSSDSSGPWSDIK